MRKPAVRKWRCGGWIVWVPVTTNGVSIAFAQFDSWRAAVDYALQWRGPLAGVTPR